MRAATFIKAACGFLLFGGITLLGPGGAAAIDTVADYQKSPAFVTSPVQPLTMLLLDNTGSMGNAAYTDTYTATKNYYGLFENDKYYYHPFNTGSTNVCNYTGISGSCSSTHTEGTCSYPTRTCSTPDSYYTCSRPATTSGSYNNSVCDGADSNTSSDCPSGASCVGDTYTCRTADLFGSSGSKCSGSGSLSCSSGYTCTQAYTCASGGGTYGSSLCDNNNDGISDCSGGASDCDAKSGSSKVVCLKNGGVDSGTYDNNICDGADAGAITDCASGSGCVTKTYTCSVPATTDGFSYKNSSICDGSDANTTTDCGSGYSCVAAYQCVKAGQTPTGVYDNAVCDGSDANTTTDCNTGSGWSCAAISSTTTANWSGSPCSTCAGTCADTGTTSVSGYDCLADSHALCDDYDGWSCTSHDVTSTCNWSDYVQKAICLAGGGTCTGDTLTPDLEGSCTTPADQADCATLYHGTCNVVLVDLTTRAPYWRKTPADATNALGWNCNTGDCVGGTVTYGNRLNHDEMNQMDVAKKVLIGGKRAAVSSIPDTIEIDGDYSNMNYTCAVGGGTYSRNYCNNADHTKRVCTNLSICSQVGDNGNIVLQPGEDPKGILQNFEGLSWGFGVLNDNSGGSSGTPNGGVIKNYVGSSNADIVQSINDTAANGATDLAEGLNTVVNYFRQSVQEYNATVSYTCIDLTDPTGSTTIGSYANNYCDNTDISLRTCLSGAECIVKSSEYLRNTTWDPFFDNAAQSYAPCGRGSVIVITDGEPNQDDSFNQTVRNFAADASGVSDFDVETSSNYTCYKAADGTTTGSYTTASCDGSDANTTTDCTAGYTCIKANGYFLDDVSFWAHTHDLRTDAPMGGSQPLDVYMIYAFGNDATSIARMKNSAVLGGFTDKNGDGKPNTRAYETDPTTPADLREWDFNGDGVADNYADASEGDQLAGKLQNMLGQIQQKVSSGSAASVISASRSGEGAIYQAIFYPKTPPDDAFRKITWVGDVHALWLDDYGNMREDCDVGDTDDGCTSADATLNTKTDKIVEFYSDATTGEAMVRTFRDVRKNLPYVAANQPFEDLVGNSHYSSGTCSVSVTKNGRTVDPTDPLAKFNEDIREFDCTSKGGTWDPAGSPDFISTTPMKDFSHYLWSGGRWLANADATPQKWDYTSTAPLRYILTNQVWGHWPWAFHFDTLWMQAFYGFPTYQNLFNASSQAEADKIANYTRGVDYTGYRSRVYDWGWGDGAQVNKLGDIVGSTPTIVAKPAEDYDLVYADKSYQRFRKRYDNRRIMVYAGGNDGGLHAFNGGFYERADKQFIKAPPLYPITNDPLTQTYASQYDLGAEMWMYIPKNILPHLKWLTDINYNHVYYIDLKPYVFDAKIFFPDAVCSTDLYDPGCVHPDGWGTVLVGGMGFGGGDFTIDTNGDGVKDSTMRSTYFILDITNPESPPVLLREFSGQDNDGLETPADSHLGFTLAAPTAVPMLRCDRRASVGLDVCPSNADAANTWPMDWYLAFGSGPHNDSVFNPTGIQNALLGKSDQEARIYLLDLGGTNDSSKLPLGLTYAGGNGWVWTPPYLAAGYPKLIPAASFPKSFFSDLIAVDYDLDYKTDVLYFGSISNTDKAAGAFYKGGMHRLVTGESLTPSTWTLNTMFNAGKPVSAAPTASWDGSRAWVFFGTGRLLNAFEDKAPVYTCAVGGGSYNNNICDGPDVDSTSDCAGGASYCMAEQQTYYGLKESYDATNHLQLYTANGGNLVDVSKVWVENGTGVLYNTDTNAPAVLTTTTGTLASGSPLAATNFQQLNIEIAKKDSLSGLDTYNGWKIDFQRLKERNLGQAALLGSTLTFTTYIPSSDICSAEGESIIWAPYYRTGTAYFKPVLGLADRDGMVEAVRETTPVKGMTLTPSIHSGAESGTKALIQTSTGAIISVDQAVPGVVKSGIITWRDKGAE